VKGGGGGAKPKKKFIPSKKLEKKKIFPGIAPKKKLLPWKKQSCRAICCSNKRSRANFAKKLDNIDS
jgi:hypothetical protein